MRAVHGVADPSGAQPLVVLGGLLLRVAADPDAVDGYPSSRRSMMYCLTSTCVAPMASSAPKGTPSMS